MQDRRENAAANGCQVEANDSAIEISFMDSPTDNETETRLSDELLSLLLSRVDAAAKRAGERR